MLKLKKYKLVLKQNPGKPSENLPVTRQSSYNQMLTLSSFSPKQMSVAAISSLLRRTNARQAFIWEDIQCSGSLGIVREVKGQADALLPELPTTVDWAWPAKAIP